MIEIRGTAGRKRHKRIRARSAVGLVAGAAKKQHELAALDVQRPALADSSEHPEPNHPKPRSRTAHTTRSASSFIPENNRVETDHGRLKARLRPMRGLKRDRTASVVIRGHAFVQNLRRGHYELGVNGNRHLEWQPRSTNSPW